MQRFLAFLLGKEERPARRRRLPRTDEVTIDRGVGEVDELKAALRHYAREAARSAAARDGMREVEELKRALRERAAELAARERKLSDREQELAQLERELRSSRRGRKRVPEGRRRRRPRAEPASQDSDS